MTERKAQTKYQAVVEAILSQIKSGRYEGEQQLPSESELCHIHQVGRNTIRHAISELVNLNYLRTIPGVGTFVVGDRFTKTAEYLYGLSREMQNHGKTVTSRVLDASIISADPFLSRRLQVQLGAEVVFLYRLRLMDGEPTAIERSYLPHGLCPGLLEYDFTKSSLYETLSMAYDKRPDHAEQVIEAGLATPDVAKLLGLHPPAVVFIFHRETQLADGRVIEYVDSELRSDRFRFYTNLRLHAPADEYTFRRMPLHIGAAS